MPQTSAPEQVLPEIKPNSLLGKSDLLPLVLPLIRLIGRNNTADSLLATYLSTQLEAPPIERDPAVQALQHIINEVTTLLTSVNERQDRWNGGGENNTKNLFFEFRIDGKSISSFVSALITGIVTEPRLQTDTDRPLYWEDIRQRAARALAAVPPAERSSKIIWLDISPHLQIGLHLNEFPTNSSKYHLTGYLQVKDPDHSLETKRQELTRQFRINMALSATRETELEAFLMAHDPGADLKSLILKKHGTQVELATQDEVLQVVRDLIEQFPDYQFQSNNNSSHIVVETLNFILSFEKQEEKGWIVKVSPKPEFRAERQTQRQAEISKFVTGILVPTLEASTSFNPIDFQVSGKGIRQQLIDAAAGSQFSSRQILEEAIKQFEALQPPALREWIASQGPDAYIPDIVIADGSKRWRAQLILYSNPPEYRVTAWSVVPVAKKPQSSALDAAAT